MKDSIYKKNNNNNVFIKTLKRKKGLSISIHQI